MSNKPRIYLDNCCYNRPYDEPFDYTKWHSTLYEGMSVREISAMAQKRREAERRQQSE